MPTSISEIKKAAQCAAVASQLPGRSDGPADAYRHLAGGAELARQYGEIAARTILSANEFYESLDSDKSEATKGARSMDAHNNEIAIQIGLVAKSWEEVNSLTQKVIQESLVGTKAADVNAKHWKRHSDGNLTTPGTVDIGQGVRVNKISLLPSNQWYANPKVDGRRIKPSEANWPDSKGKWLERFTPNPCDYNGKGLMEQLHSMSWAAEAMVTEGAKKIVPAIINSIPGPITAPPSASKLRER